MCARSLCVLLILCVCVRSSGIGGGCMLLVYNGTTGEVRAVDGREEAPALFTPSAFCIPNTNCTASYPFMPDQVTGGHPVGVPGTLATIAFLMTHFGTLPLANLTQYAIELADNGGCVAARCCCVGHV